MADEPDIVQKIVITAEDDATPVLQRMGAQIQATVQSATNSVQQFGSGFKTGFVDAFTQATTATKPAAAAVEDMGEKFKLTRGEVREFGMVLRELGLGPLAEITRLLGGVGVHFGVFAAAAAGIAGTGYALVRFAEAATASAEAIERLHDATDADEESLSSLQYAFGQTGTSTKDFEKALTSLADAAKGAEEATGDLAQSQLKVVDAQIAYEKARAAAAGEKPDPAWIDFYNQSAARLKEVVAQQNLLTARANDLQKVVQQFQDLAKGISTDIDPLTKVETQVKAVGIVLGQAGLSVKDLSKNIGDMGAQAQQAVYKFADIMKALSPDEARRLGEALKMSPEAIDSFRRGGDALKAAQAEAQRLGLVLSKEDMEAVKGLREAWNEFTNLFSAFTQKLGAEAAPVIKQFLDSFKQGMKDVIQDFQNLPLDQAIQNLINRLGPLLQKIGDVVAPFVIQAGLVIGRALVQGVLDAIVEAGNKIVANFVQELKDNWNILLQNLAILGQKVTQYIIQPFVDAWNNLKQIAVAAWNAITQPFYDAWNALVKWFEDKVNTVLDLINQIKQGAIAAWKALKGLFGAGTPEPEGVGVPAAAGGYIMGPGTATSDSIPAWLSAGEFVMRAAAVQAYGLRAMQAINTLNAPRFAGGGLVLAPVPSMAMGGTPSLTGQRVLNLSIEGRSFQGLQIPERTAQSLERFAVHSQIASTGRKQSWRR